MPINSLHVILYIKFVLSRFTNDAMFLLTLWQWMCKREIFLQWEKQILFISQKSSGKRCKEMRRWASNLQRKDKLSNYTFSKLILQGLTFFLICFTLFHLNSYSIWFPYKHSLVRRSTTEVLALCGSAAILSIFVLALCGSATILSIFLWGFLPAAKE